MFLLLQFAAYVKESLSRPLQEVRFAELEGRDLQSFDEFMAELDKEIFLQHV